MKPIQPVLLAGGSGTRLWPLSRKSHPKQFASIFDKETLFQQSALRVQQDNSKLFLPPITLTNNDFRFVVAEQLQEVGVDPGAIILEPSPKNTAPSILIACLHSLKTDPDCILLVMPSDHVIKDIPSFQAAVSSGIDAVKNGQIVTFGITPTYAETGFGYLECSDITIGVPSPVSRFIEKPKLELAQDMLNEGGFLWNAGIFLFRARDMISAFETHMPNCIKCAKDALQEASTDLGFIRLHAESWAQLDELSIDYAIIEKLKNISALPVDFGWSDLGGWKAIWEETPKGDDGVGQSSDVVAIDCSNTLLRSESNRQTIVGIGLHNIVAVAMSDAVLISDISQTEKVKLAVTELKNNKVKQAEEFPKEFRPWGWFESLVIGERFQVKRIFVKPGASLSLQSHHHRSEHWIIVNGTAKVIIDETIKLLTEGESIYIPLGSKHRLENPGLVPMLLVEVQTGTYLGEDDIIRYEDIYNRNLNK